MRRHARCVTVDFYHMIAAKMKALLLSKQIPLPTADKPIRWYGSWLAARKRSEVNVNTVSKIRPSFHPVFRINGHIKAIRDADECINVADVARGRRRGFRSR